MKKIKLLSIKINANYENLLNISQEIAQAFGNIVDNNVVEVAETTETEILEGNIDYWFCPAEVIQEKFKETIEEKQNTFSIQYESPYFEYENQNGEKGLTCDIIELSFEIFE